MNNRRQILFTLTLLLVLSACGNPASKGVEVNNGVRIVDMGLSVAWATTNLAAQKQIDMGDIYSWGETQPISREDNRSVYKWEKDGKIIKYCTNNLFGKNDGRNQLENEDDAAVALGGGFRMPTIQEWEELFDKCDWHWISWRGSQGYKVVSRITHESIFLPVEKFADSNSIYDLNIVFYWSSSLQINSCCYAWCVRLGGYKGYGRKGDNRSSQYDCRRKGFYIRPVWQYTNK